MTAQSRKNALAAKRKARVRGKLFGTAERPRLTVFRSNKYTYLQVINDETGVVVAAANDKSLAKASKKALTGTKSDRAAAAATSLAEQLKASNVSKLAFDRGSYRYHGRLKMVADTVRAAGIEV